MGTKSWKERAAQMKFNGQAFINGERVDAVSGATFECISPCNGQKLTDVARCDKADVDIAVKAADTMLSP